MSKEFTEVDILGVSIQEDLTDDDEDNNTKHKTSRTTTTSAASGRSHAKRKPGHEDRDKKEGLDKKDDKEAEGAGDALDGSPATGTGTGTGTGSKAITLSSKEKLKRQNRRMGQKAASLKFSALDFVALSPDKLKKHYTIGKLIHRGTSNNTNNTNNNLNSSTHTKRDKRQSTATGNSSSHHEGMHHANVHICLHRDTGIQRAVKVVKKNSSWNRAQNQVLVREFKILQTLDHPSLIRTYELFEGRDHFYIVMDLCHGGDLCQELDTWGPLQEQDAALILKQLLSVVNYLHSNRIVHGNIKPEHILLEQDKDLDHVKLTDFACAEIMEDQDDPDDGNAEQGDGDDNDKENSNHPDATKNLDVESLFSMDDDSASDTDDDDDDELNQSTLTSESSNRRSRSSRAKSILPERKGSVDFWAPEVVLKGSIGPKRDVWACGVLCYLLLSNRLPFRGESREQICENIIRGEFFLLGEGEEENENDEFISSYAAESKSTDFYSDYLEDGGESPLNATFDWANVSDLAKSFLRQLLTYEEHDRPTAKQALQHPWIAEMTSLSSSVQRTDGDVNRF
ncbi:MAP kinase-interacting serine/threonine-protein kinase 2 (Partial), partial [Seminavis robusta]|eukprot:Sro201_g085260.1 MAP kinase-interacting serine/threonine-protein kinase 2 (567) ;mRNA; f:91338-93039